VNIAVAKERKKEKFTALFHHIDVDLLEEAFYELKADAAPGVDQVTFAARATRVAVQASLPVGRPCRWVAGVS
jgi:hypothetical protein